MQQQITIAAALPHIAPHNTPARRANASAAQALALPHTRRHEALSNAPGCNALLFAMLNAHLVAWHAMKIAAQRHSRADRLPPHDFCTRFRARAAHPSMRVGCHLLPERQQSITIGGLLLIQISIIHYASHRVRHHTGRLKSPAVRPRCGVCRRLHVSHCCKRNTQPCAVEPPPLEAESTRHASVAI